MFRRSFLACLAAGALATIGPASAESVYDTLPFAEAISGKSVYLVPWGGRQMLTRDQNGPSIAALPRSFDNVRISLIGAQAADVNPQVELQPTSDCGSAGPCYAIKADGGWTLRTFRPADGEPLRGGQMALDPGMPFFAKDTGGPGASINEQHPRLVLSPHPTVGDAFLIRELAYSNGSYGLTDNVLINLDDPDRVPREIFNADKAKVNSYWNAFNVVPIANAGDTAVWRIKRYTPCRLYTGTQCFWMENITKNWCYVPAAKYGGVSPETCYELNSCGEGGGKSGGGCYKWADTSASPRIPFRK